MTNDETSCFSSVESYLLYSVSPQISAIKRVFLFYQFSSFAPSSLASKIRVSLSVVFSFSFSQLPLPKFRRRNEASVDPDVRRRNRVG